MKRLSDTEECGIKQCETKVCIPTRTVSGRLKTLIDTIGDNVTPIIFEDVRSSTVTDIGDLGSAVLVTKDESKKLLSRICTRAGFSSQRDRSRITDLVFENESGLESLRGAGSNRNSMLLTCAGGYAVSFDDDTEFRFSTIDTTTRRPVEFEKDQLPAALAFFDTIERLNSILRPWDGDPIHAMISPFDRADDSEYAFASMIGVAGARWFQRPTATLYAREDFHRISYGNRRRYRAMTRNPLAIVQVPVPALARTPLFFNTTGFAVDATRLLPPFPTATRSEDVFWAGTALRCMPKGKIAHLPFCIHHDPAMKVSFDDADSIDNSADFDMLSLFILQYLNRGASYEEGAEAFRSLAHRFLDIAGLTDGEWREFCHTVWLEYVAGIVTTGEERLERQNGRPKWWAADFEDYLERLKEQALDPDNAQAKELRRDVDATHAGRLHRGFFRRYGELLTVWPELWDAATELNRSGEGLLP